MAKISKLKEQAWNEFSRFIRLRDRLEDPDTGCITDYAACCTCGKTAHWKELQAGHFVPGRMNSILFDEQGCHAQCRACNLFKNGNLIEYWPFMEKKYGKRVINRIKKASKQTRKFTKEELVEIRDRYKKLADQLERA